MKKGWRRQKKFHNRSKTCARSFGLLLNFCLPKMFLRTILLKRVEIKKKKFNQTEQVKFQPERQFLKLRSRREGWECVVGSDTWSLSRAICRLAQQQQTTFWRERPFFQVEFYFGFLVTYSESSYFEMVQKLYIKWETITKMRWNEVKHVRKKACAKQDSQLKTAQWMKTKPL